MTGKAEELGPGIIGWGKEHNTQTPNRESVMLLIHQSREEKLTPEEVAGGRGEVGHKIGAALEKKKKCTMHKKKKRSKEGKKNKGSDTCPGVPS